MLAGAAVNAIGLREPQMGRAGERGRSVAPG
jgi:hypothetical protein